jgi:dienelactone hydrolase
MEDLRAVMDATDAKCAALFGFSEGGNLAMTFAAAQLFSPTTPRNAVWCVRLQVP